MNKENFDSRFQKLFSLVEDKATLDELISKGNMVLVYLSYVGWPCRRTTSSFNRGLSPWLIRKTAGKYNIDLYGVSFAGNREMLQENMEGLPVFFAYNSRGEQVGRHEGELSGRKFRKLLSEWYG